MKPARRSVAAINKESLIRTPLRIGCALARPLRAFGVDQARVRALLEVRLLDELGRRRSGKDGRPPGMAAGFVMSMLLYLLYGLMLALVVSVVEEPFAGITYALAFAMVYTTMSLMVDHVPSLLETNDLAVLGPLPVDGRTVLAARVVHALTYFLMLLGALGGPSLIAGSIRFGPWPFAPMYLLALLLVTATSFGLALVATVGVLRFGSPRATGTLLVATQTLGLVCSFAVPQMMQFLGKGSAEWLLAPGSPWPWVLPPAHGAALVAATLPGGPVLVGPLLLAFGVPCALLSCLALLARDFQGRLAALRNADRTARPPRRRWLRDLLLRDREAIAGYDFAAAMTARERRFKMLAWPQIAAAWFLGGWLVFSARRADAADPRIACIALYMVGMSLAQILPVARFADDWQGRWVFRANPLASPARFTAGAVLAVTLRFALPSLVLTAAVILLLARQYPLDFLLALLLTGNLALFGVRTQEQRLLFTQKFAMGTGGHGIERAMLLMLIAAALGGVQFLLSGSAIGLPVGGAAAAALLVVQWRAFTAGLRNRGTVAIDWVEDDQVSPVRRTFARREPQATD